MSEIADKQFSRHTREGGNPGVLAFSGFRLGAVRRPE
jgi:hypothetical protein